MKNTPKNLLPDNCILASLRGSYSEGTYIEGISDIDIIAVHIAPLEHYLGFRKDGLESNHTITGEWDVQSYEIRKLFHMLLAGNPNVVSVLFVPNEMLPVRTALGSIIRNRRNLFLSKKFYKSFKGYSMSMRGRLRKQEFEGHRSDVRQEEDDSLGYNPKTASEMLRIAEFGIQLLKTGSIQYPLPEDKAAFLKNVKQGEIALDTLLDMHRKKMGILEYWSDHTSLPEEPDRGIAEEVLMRIIKMEHNL